MRTPLLTVLRPRLITIASALACVAVFQTAHAAVYGGQGLIAGINAASGLGGIVAATSITDLILKIINFILNLVLIVAVLAIIIAGIYLITSNGDEGQKDKAKKIIFYVIAGIILILLSKVIVLFVNNIF